MNLHNELQPHHHVAIWAFSAFAVLLSVLIYTNTAVGQVLGEQSEPSKETKEFFGFDEEKEGEYEFTTPPECDYQEEGEKINQLSNEIQTLYDQLYTLQIKDTSQMTEDELLAHQQEIKDLESKIDSKQKEVDGLSTNISSGPTVECKKALVSQAIQTMEKMQPEMKSKFLGKLTQVEEALAKVETVIPELEESDVEKEKLDKIKAHVANIKTSVATLRSFFLKMSETMNNWIASAKSDPLKAFDLMQNGQMFNEGDSGKAVSAADTMVSSFKELIKVFDEIVANEGG